MITTATINSKTFGRGYLTAITMVDGFASPTVQSSMYYNSGNHGGKIPNSYWRERILVFDLSVRGTSVATYVAERDAIIKAFGLPRTGIATMTFTTLDGRNLQFDVQLRNITGPFQRGQNSFGNLRVELIAPSPYIIAQSATDTAVTLPSGAGTVIPAIIPMDLSFGSGVGETITLSGNGLYFPTVTIVGPCTDPIIRNNTTSLQIQVTGTFTGSDTIVVDMENETVTQNGSTNLLENTVGDFWALVAGANAVIFSSGIYDAAASATFTWRDSWLGI